LRAPHNPIIGKQTINPNDVDLLIFDLDGTILSSTKPVFEAIKKAFAKLNLTVQISEEEIEKYLGPSSSDDFYEAITPIDKGALWQEVRSGVREEQDASLREFAHVFPGVIETLQTLKRRGYRLVLYSNSSIQYFNCAISALNIKDYFDYAECVQENNLTKTELVRKFKNKFSNIEATTVVGDRIDDIEAARENNALSVGVLYGYGDKEPEQADITISKFPELLDIFDRKLPIFEKILKEIETRKKKDRAFVIGISGIDCSGKSMFVESFEKCLISRGFETQLISIDDFHNPKVYRYSGKNQIENYYNKSFDIKTIVEKLLIQVHEKSSYSTRLTVLNWQTDKYDTEKEFTFNQNTIVIFEGVFLFRKELSPYIDYKVFIEITFEESKRRAKIRDSEETFRKYEGTYLPAQRRYLDEFPPSETADMIIDNSNWEYPGVKLHR